MACQKRPTYNEQRCLSLLLRRQANTRAHSSLLGRECPAVVLPARNDDNTVRKRARCLADDLLEDEYRSNVCCRSSIYVCGNSFMPTAVVAGTLGFVHKMCAQRFPANRMLLGAFACCVLLAQALRVEKEYVLTSAYFLTVLDHVFWSCLRVFAATDSHPNTEIQSKTRKQKLERRELTCFNMLCLPSRCIEVSKHFLTADRAVCPYPVSPFLIVNTPPPLLLLFLCSRALHLREASMRLVADEIVFNHAVEQGASIIQDRDQGPCSSPPPLHLNIPSVQHVLYRDTLCAEQTHSSLLCSAWYLSAVPA